MANYGFVQVPCTKCGTTVWISPAAGMGICPSCHTQNNLPQGAAPQAGGMPGAMPGMPNTSAPPMAMPAVTGGGGFPMFKAIGGGLVVVLLAGGGIAFSVLKKRFIAPKGKMTYSAAGLKSSDNPDGDVMMTGVAANAKKWKKDAYWWSTNYQAVRNDGTVDVSKGAQVMYISPSRVSSPAKTVRKDSIRKYVFTSSFVDHSRIWNATNQWKGVAPPAMPTCTIKQLAKNLEKEGLTKGKTVRISFDPQFDWGTEQVWHVRGEDPKIDQRYSFKDCSKVDKDGAPTGKGDAAGGEGEGGEGEAE